MKPKIVIGVVLIVTAIAYLIIGGLRDTSVYYMTIPELYAKTNIAPGEGLRITGYVIPSTIKWDAEKIELRFAMTENSDTLRVFYKGIMPDQLADAQQVVVEGALDQSRTMVANKILLKCPSKYEVKGQEPYNRGY